MHSWNKEQVYFINKQLTKIKNTVKNVPQYTPRNMPKFYPEKYWVGVQQGQSYLMGRRVGFHTELVKTETGFIVRSVETGLGR